MSEVPQWGKERRVQGGGFALQDLECKLQGSSNDKD